MLLLLLLVDLGHFLLREGGSEGGKGESSFIQRPSARQKLVAKQEEGREEGRQGGREERHSTFQLSDRLIGPHDDEADATLGGGTIGVVEFRDEFLEAEDVFDFACVGLNKLKEERKREMIK